VRVGRVFRGVGGSGVVVLWAPSVFELKKGNQRREAWRLLATFGIKHS
jgi:hypothetical protein